MKNSPLCYLFKMKRVFLHVDAENWEWYTQDLKFVEHLEV